MEFSKVYFLGIGGIATSALARYFLHVGKLVAGYDRTASRLTAELEAEGASVHYDDDIRAVPEEFLDPHDTIVVYTPAVPQEHCATSPNTASPSRSVRRCWVTWPRAST